MGCAQNLLLITQRAPKKATSIQSLSLSAYRAIALNNKLSSSFLVLVPCNEYSSVGISLAGYIPMVSIQEMHSNPPIVLLWV